VQHKERYLKITVQRFQCDVNVYSIFVAIASDVDEVSSRLCYSCQSRRIINERYTFLEGLFFHAYVKRPGSITMAVMCVLAIRLITAT